MLLEPAILIAIISTVIFLVAALDWPDWPLLIVVISGPGIGVLLTLVAVKPDEFWPTVLWVSSAAVLVLTGLMSMLAASAGPKRR